MVFLRSRNREQWGSGSVQQVQVRCVSYNERAAFASALSEVRQEPLYRMTSCDKSQHFYRILNYLIENNYLYKVVSKHTTDKPWDTDTFRPLISLR